MNELLVFIVVTSMLPFSQPIASHSLQVPGFIFKEPTINETILNPDAFPYDDASKCEVMRISFCENVGYNRTMLPNVLGHSTQAEVDGDIAVYQPFIQNSCSPDIRLFLCTVYAPICFDHGHESEVKLQPCQSLCEMARRGCEIHFKYVGREWPEFLNCDRFPDSRQKVLCVGNDTHNTIESPSSTSSSLAPSSTSATEQPILRDLGFVCPKNFEVNGYSLYLNGRKYNNCAMPCEDVYLDKGSSYVVRLAVGILSIIGIISSTFTCITYLIDTKRFEYPARPIIIIAFCQLVVATCFLIGFLTHNKIACNEPLEPPKTLPNMRMIRPATQGNKKGSCTLLFMTLYFFVMSTVLWWLMMTISWYMIAKLKWAPEAVKSVSRYFHFSSWTIPALMTIYLSVLGDIEGDSLSGTCFISTSSSENSIKTFIVLPMTISLIMGVFFLSAGLKSIWDSRQVLRLKYGDQTDEHFKLVTRIGLYSVLFIMFISTFIYLHGNEQSSQTNWRLAWLSQVCKIRDYSIPCPTRNYSNYGPHMMIFVVKYAATMAIGMISALFMASEKTYRSYREVAAMYHP